MFSDLGQEISVLYGIPRNCFQNPQVISITIQVNINFLLISYILYFGKNIKSKILNPTSSQLLKVSNIGDLPHFLELSRFFPDLA